LQLAPESVEHEGELIEKIRHIAFQDLSYTIDKSKILQEISFEIKEGESVAIVGRSGAGKSSLISLLFALGKPSGGRLLINGKDIAAYTPYQLRRQIAYVNQRAGIFNMTLQENILYGEPMDPKRYASVKADAQCDFIKNLPEGDQTMAGEFGSHLSGGQRQRIALARALYRNSSLFVLDEATSALDSHTESLIQQSLERVMQGRTSIIIAHRLETIRQCNRVIVMEAGRIVANGSYDEVSQHKAFRRNFMMDGRE